MPIINKKIEVIALFNKNEPPKPIKLRITDEEGQLQVIKIDSVLYSKRIKIADKEFYKIICKGYIQGLIKELELRYYIKETVWVLYKI
ncbi:MAG: hypothetical protein ACOCRX_01340 [Candidatus Woesearchaeota archaeon]